MPPALAAADPALTGAEIIADWPVDQTPPKRRTLERTLKKGAGKHWLRVGNETPDSPYRYLLIEPKPEPQLPAADPAGSA